MKKLRLLLILPIIFLLSSCADLDVSYQLTDSDIINIDYQLALSSDDKSITKYTDLIDSYWLSMGFTTDTNADEGITLMNGQKEIRCESAQEAAEKFSALLTNNNSFFDDVTFVYTPTFQDDTYSLDAAISLKDKIRQAEAQNIPEDEIKVLQTGAENGEYTLSIALPGDIISTNADSQNGGACTWTLPYGETTYISLKTKKINEENIAYYKDLSDTYQIDSQLFITCCIVAGLLIMGVIVILVIRSHRRKNTSKVRIKKF